MLTAGAQAFRQHEFAPLSFNRKLLQIIITHFSILGHAFHRKKVMLFQAMCTPRGLSKNAQKSHANEVVSQARLFLEGTSGHYCRDSVALAGMLAVPIRFDYVFVGGKST